MPRAPPLERRSWCHTEIAVLPCTATCGSTSALGNVLPVSKLSAGAHPAYGDGPLMSVPPATVIEEVTNASPPASAHTNTDLRINFINPPLSLTTAAAPLTLVPARAVAQPGDRRPSLGRLERADRRNAW